MMQEMHTCQKKLKFSVVDLTDNLEYPKPCTVHPNKA